MLAQPNPQLLGVYLHLTFSGRSTLSPYSEFYSTPSLLHCKGHLNLLIYWIHLSLLYITNLSNLYLSATKASIKSLLLCFLDYPNCSSSAWRTVSAKIFKYLWNKWKFIFQFIHASKALPNLFYAKSLQSCPTLCDPIDGSPQGSPVPGIPQARTLEWVAISFSNAWKWKVKVKSLSRVRPSATP